MPTFAERLALINNLPSLPTVVSKLRAMLADSEVEVVQVGRVIEEDPSIMANVLRMANSPLYGGYKNVTSLKMAITRMGLMTISNFVLSTSVMKIFPGTQSLADRNQFWIHSNAVGSAMVLLNDKTTMYAPCNFKVDELQLCGLLHDMGRIVLEQFFNDEFYACLMEAKKSNFPLEVIEQNILGMNHADVGAWLARKWLLPDMMESVIRHHHDPMSADEPCRYLACLTHVADYLCHLLPSSSSGTDGFHWLERDALRFLGLSMQDILLCTESLEARVQLIQQDIAR